MKCGIYKITNKINGNMYIGYSNNIERRWNEHKNVPFQSQKKDNLEKVLYIAIRKHGLENFQFEIIEECEESKLKEREIYWIAHYKTYKDRKHYNTTPGGDGVDMDKILKGEAHGMAELTEEEVVYCRICYKDGLRSRNIYSELFEGKITYSGFLRMWHGKTWKHVMPEAFVVNPHRASYGEADRDILIALFKESGMKIHNFVKTEDCYVGYGTLYKMLNTPEFYNGK